MSNRKAKASRRPKRAPRDAATAGEAPLPVRRDYKGLVISGLKVALGITLVLAAAGGLAFGVHRYARTTPRFAIEKIVVEGTQRLVRSQVLEMAEVKLGNNVFALEVEKAERQLLASPWIKKVRITRRLPGTVRIELTERQPRALAVLGTETFVVSREGEPFKTLGAGDPHDLPLVTGLSVAELARDRRAELARLADALELIHDYEELPLSKAYPAQEVHLTDAGHAVLNVGERGVALHLGPAPWKKKLLRASRVIDRAQREKARPSVVFLDNDAHPERVVVRLQ